MASGNLAERLDTVITDFFASWNIYTTIIAGLALVALIYPLFTRKDPDTHPFLLARQAVASPIRQPGESAVYRSTEIPYGYPLRAGLAVKDPGAPKWSSGRNGDLRDVWRQAVQGPLKEDGSSAGPRGKIMTVLGREKVIEHDLGMLTLEINAIGKHLQENGSKVVAVCLSNSVELLSTIFAGAFHGFSPVLMPYGLEYDQSKALLTKFDADTIIAEAGTIPLDSIFSAGSSIRRIIWVTKAGNMHLDWNEVPAGVGGKVDISTWHDVADDTKSAVSSDVLPVDKESKVLPVLAFWPSKSGSYELFEYSSESLISAIAGLSATHPRNYKLGPNDLLMSTMSLTETYPFCWTLAALFANASIALNSVAGDSVNLDIVAYGISPTIIVASSTAVSRQHDELATSGTNGLTSLFSTYVQKRSLDAGSMPSKKPAAGPSQHSTFGNVRLLLISQREKNTASVPSTVLSNLRLGLGARIGYALTAGPVAGAICQTNILDYRDKGEKVSFGPPVSSVEVHLTGEDSQLDTEHPLGNISVKGPAVVGGKVVLDVTCQIDYDNTFLLA